MNQRERIVLWPARRRPASHLELIGPKAASLCTLRRLGMKVPPCFFVTTTAFREHLDTGGLRPQMESLLNKLDVQAAPTPSVLEEVRQLIVRASLADDSREQITASYRRLAAGVVAVRSSATAEDLPGHSFAGQYETILGVTSLERCLEAIKECWSSLWTERAYEYRRRNGIDHRQVEMAVIVQEQIEPDAAGVAFTLDPVTGSRSRIVIESCRGLGEALVSGHVQPERMVLRKKNLALLRKPPSIEQNPDPVLALKSAQALARRVRRIERKLGCPQDIEWAARDGRLWFLQARPITAIPEPRPWEDRQVWSNLNLGEVVPDVMTPMTRSMIVPMFLPFFGTFLRFFGADPEKSRVVDFVAGRLYFNVNTGLAVGRPLGIGPDRASRFGTAMGGDQARLYEAGALDICEEDLPDLGFRWSRYICSWPGLIRALIVHRPGKADQMWARIRRHADELLDLDPAALETVELARLAGRSLYENLHDLDLLYLLPGAAAAGVLGLVCRRWLDAQDLTLIYRLFAAQGGIADTEAGLDLWRLALLAHQDKQTQALVLSGGEWRAVHRKLAETQSGRDFLASWDRLMAEHGHHCRGELELGNPRWSETPDYILGVVRGYLRSVGQTDPLANQQRLAAQRRDLTEQCRRRLRNPLKRHIFNWALANSQKLAADRENWKNVVVRQIAGFRRLVLALGERLRSQGVLSSRDDVFFLELPELETVAQGRANFDIRGRIAERRAEYEKNRALSPPPVVAGCFDPDRHLLPQIDSGAKVLSGIAVSPGVVTGKARVILRTDDHEHVEAGEILVAPFTDPAWTPYFLTAAGVVMDQGGVLSHGAIIAREYGIPAVVNVGPASQLLRTGQTIRVDGDHGTVTILDQT